MNPAENYILEQPEPYKSMLLHLQLVIESTVPSVELKYKYRIPFYYVNGKPFCFISSQLKKKYVDVGFWSSAHLTKHLEHMTVDGRKVLKSMRYRSIDEIDNAILSEILLDAYSVKENGFWK